MPLGRREPGLSLPPCSAAAASFFSPTSLRRSEVSPMWPVPARPMRLAGRGSWLKPGALGHPEAAT